MKILITGANGFLGKYLESFFKDKYDVYALSREHLNVCNDLQVTNTLEMIRPNVVIHCAAQGRYTPMSADPYILQNNLLGFTNLVENKPLYDKLINIGSGAEFGLNRPLDKIKEYEVMSSFPKESYGLSKNLITRMIYEMEGFCNIRLFGCFDASENDDRVLKILMNNLMNDKPFVLKTDRLFDMVWAYDVGVMIDNVIKNNSTYDKDINCVYKHKMLLSDIFQSFIRIHGLNKNLLKVEGEYSHNYTGSFKRTKFYSDGFKGLEAGFEQYK